VRQRPITSLVEIMEETALRMRTGHSRCSLLRCLGKSNCQSHNELLLAGGEPEGSRDGGGAKPLANGLAESDAAMRNGMQRVWRILVIVEPRQDLAQESIIKVRNGTAWRTMRKIISLAFSRAPG